MPKAWFSFGHFEPSVDARFGFLLPVLVFAASMSVFAFCCFSLPVVALSGFSLLLIPTTFHRYRGSLELKQMNENGNEKCSLLLFVAHFGFWDVLPLPSVVFSALRCSFLFLR